METLHPQWDGYGYTWRRDLNAIQPEQYGHGGEDAPQWLNSPFYDLIRRARSGEDEPSMRRRLEVWTANRKSHWRAVQRHRQFLAMLRFSCSEFMVTRLP